VVQRGGLLRDDRGADAVGHDQDRRREVDALGHGGGSGQRHQRLVVGVDDPVDRPSEENPAASALLAHSVTCCPVTPGIVVGRPTPIFTWALLS
jgi:hypothetical protein